MDVSGWIQVEFRSAGQPSPTVTAVTRVAGTGGVDTYTHCFGSVEPHLIDPILPTDSLFLLSRETLSQLRYRLKRDSWKIVI